jgi:hypothetical protein
MLGMAIADTQTFEKAIQAMIHEAKTIGIKIGGPNLPSDKDSRLKNVLNTVVCCPSHMSPGIQLADYVAYATFSHHERAQSRRYNQVRDLWRTVGYFTEPSVVPREKSLYE